MILYFVLVFLVLKLMLEQVNINDYITLCFLMLSDPITPFYTVPRNYVANYFKVRGITAINGSSVEITYQMFSTLNQTMFRAFIRVVAYTIC